MATATGLSGVDRVVLRSTIQPNILKGNFAEAHMERHLIQHLGRDGGWSPLSARIGAQGLDGLYIRCDASGRPSGLMVSEAKYGSARLGQTADGIQMGGAWRSKRLDAMGRTYRTIGESIRSGQIRVAGVGGSVGRDRLQLKLPGSGKAAVFTRPASNRPWEFVGPRSLLPEAADHLDRVGRYLQQAGRGEVAYESTLFKMKLRDGTLHVTVRDAATLGPGVTEGKLPIRRSFQIHLTDRQLGSSRTSVQRDIAQQIRDRFPHLSGEDARTAARQMVRTARDLERLVNSRPPSVAGAVARNTARIGGGAAAFDVALNVLNQYQATGRVDWRDVATSAVVSFGSAAGGAAVGQATTAILMRSAASQQVIARASTVLGLGSARLMPSLIGGTVGGGVTSILFALGGYMTGTYDAQTAARMGITGVSSAAIGMAAGAGILAFATTFGTASTGTAIAALNGAIATNAALAWLGGGTLAAGGFGMAGGAVMITGGVAIVAIGTGVLINYAWSYWDEGQDRERIRLTIERLSRKTQFVAVGMPIRGGTTTKIGQR